MKELVVISGKGGTGKTSIVACFAVLAEKKVLADCDVDAADLYLVLEPKIQVREEFRGGKRARILREKCSSCGKCMELCRFDAIRTDGSSGAEGSAAFEVDPIACEGCGVCARFCPSEAIEFKEVVNGEWFVSETRHGPMVHAKLGIAEGNSGKLVTVVRDHARTIAEERGLDLILVDGSPGIGCPVIASITGADLVLIVTEPTLSGEHDLNRAYELVRHFQIPAVVCVNKFDLNRQMSSRIQKWCTFRGIPVVGEIPYDANVTRAQVNGKSVVEYDAGLAAESIRNTWNEVRSQLG